MTWTGPGEDLRGVVFGRMTVEAPAPMDGAHVRVTCRCACGRVAIRRVADLRAEASPGCRVCLREDERAATRKAAAARKAARFRERYATDEEYREHRRAIARASYAERYEATKDKLNARRRELHRERGGKKRPRAPKPCAIPDCKELRGGGRTRYCDVHGALPQSIRRELMGARIGGPRAGEPGWDARRENDKERRRRKRATDPAFRELEARLAREYRERKRAKEAA